MDIAIELKKTIQKARDELDEIETAKRREKASKAIGRCFRYWNSYSCPQGPEDRWWLYSRILSVNEDGYFECLQFQIDKNGKHEIGIESRSDWMLDGSWQRIDAREFVSALEDFVESVKKLALRKPPEKVSGDA